MPGLGVQAVSSYKFWKPLWVLEEAQILQPDMSCLTETQFPHP